MDTLSWIVVVIVTAAVFTAGHTVLYKRDAVQSRHDRHEPAVRGVEGAELRERPRQGGRRSRFFTAHSRRAAAAPVSSVAVALWRIFAVTGHIHVCQICATNSREKRDLTHQHTMQKTLSRIGRPTGERSTGSRPARQRGRPEVRSASKHNVYASRSPFLVDYFMGSISFHRHVLSKIGSRGA